jgi:two-component system chemotaxis sensor kinase CheA
MTIDMSQFYEVFFDEAEELLAEAEGLLLDIDLEDPDSEELNAIFRAAHSIKGGAATFGFMDMTEITHVLENLLDKIRKNEMALTAEHVDAFLSAKDVLKMELDGHRLDTDVDQDQVAEVKEVLKSFAEAGGLVISTPKGAEPAAAAPEPEVAAAPAETEPKVEATATAASEAPPVNGNFDITLLSDITEKDVENLVEEIGLLGEVELVKSPDGKHLIKLTSDDATADDILAICSFIVEADEMKIEPANAGAATSAPAAEEVAAEPAKAAAPEETSYVAETPEELAKSNKAAVESFDKKAMVEEENGYGLFSEDGTEDTEEGYGFFKGIELHKPDENAVAASDDAPAEVAKTDDKAAEDKPKAKAKAKKEDKGSAEASSIRVGIEKVDQLINLVGELVITQAMIEQRVSALDPVNNEELIDSVGQLTRNTRDLQESVMSIRMMPMDFVFSRFPRMVRDLASKLKKKVDFVTVGATTELDKGLIERIVDPLTHLVRNSVDHGIENPAARKASGKQEMGTLTLSAAHKGGSIVIEVTDDGGGLNRDKIMEKASGNGITVSDSMSDTEVFNLIFAPGFSTAEVVTDVSGRGVGMDVVKRNITAMGGTVEIRSALGFGTTISIALPLTLAILDGMSVSLGNSIYVIPLNLIVETLQPRAEDIKTVTGEGRMVHVRGEYLPIIPLHSAFNQHTDITDPTKGVLVLIESDGKKSALFVDRLVGQQQVVIKSLETNYRKIYGVSGATIMGDGCVALILDVPALIQMGQNNNYLTGSVPFSTNNDQAINKELTQ